MTVRLTEVLTFAIYPRIDALDPCWKVEGERYTLTNLRVGVGVGVGEGGATVGLCGGVGVAVGLGGSVGRGGVGPGGAGTGVTTGAFVVVTAFTFGAGRLAAAIPAKIATMHSIVIRYSFHKERR